MEVHLYYVEVKVIGVFKGLYVYILPCISWLFHNARRQCHGKLLQTLMIRFALFFNVCCFL